MTIKNTFSLREVNKKSLRICFASLNGIGETQMKLW